MIDSVKSILEKLEYEINAEDRHLAEFFNENGYCVIPKSDLVSENIDEFRKIVDSLLFIMAEILFFDFQNLF